VLKRNYQKESAFFFHESVKIRQNRRCWYGNGNFSAQNRPKLHFQSGFTPETACPKDLTFTLRIQQGGTFFMIRPYLGHAPVIPASCYIDVSAQIVGDVQLGEHSSVWMNAVLRGDVHSIRIGANSNVQDCSVLHGMRYKYPVIIGDWVTIGHNATVHGCVIEDACLIGIGARILNNATIGEGSIIAAGAVVPENTVVPPRTLWAGVPAKERRRLSPDDREMILQYAKNYLDYTATYLEESKRW
jgi:carbonic anhydrase/acetyltransferase-like protein (isoleucine patch superfamily)